MIHNTASSISLPLCLIFNSSLSKGILPSHWKNSHIIPVPESKTSSSSPSDYGQTSLLSIPSKILERHIFNSLYKFCSAHNNLFNCQFSFWLGFSTKTALLSIVNSYFFSMDFKNAVCAISFISLNHLTLSLTNPYFTLYLHLTFLLFFCLGSIVICNAVLNK